MQGWVGHRVKVWLAAIAVVSLLAVPARADDEVDPAPAPSTASGLREEVPGVLDAPTPDAPAPADAPEGAASATTEAVTPGSGEGAPQPAAEGSESASPPRGAAANPETAPAADDPAPEPGQWAPPLPNATAFDWMQMRSGEWLKGEFKTLRDYRVSFDSDEFGDLDLDWEKVAAFYLPRPHSYRVQDRVLFGTAELRGQVVRIRTKDAVYEFERKDLSDIAQGSGRELDWWSLKLGFSMTARKGNSDQVDMSGSGEVRRETAVTRFVTDYWGSFSRVDGDKTANNHRVDSSFDLFLTRRLFWRIPFVQFYTDELQNIDTRVTPGSALGYEFYRDAFFEAQASVGAAYQFTRLSSGVDERRTSHDFAVVSTVELNFDLPGGTDFDNQYRLQLVPTDFGKTSQHSESLLSLDIWGPLDLDVTFIWDRIQSPAQGGGGGDPKKDDFRLLVGFGLEF